MRSPRARLHKWRPTPHAGGEQPPTSILLMIASNDPRSSNDVVNKTLRWFLFRVLLLNFYIFFWPKFSTVAKPLDSRWFGSGIARIFTNTENTKMAREGRPPLKNHPRDCISILRTEHSRDGRNSINPRWCWRKTITINVSQRKKCEWSANNDLPEFRGHHPWY